jgi:hypothetical protein
MHRVVFAAVLLFFAIPFVSLSQDVRATISGIVQDPTGAAIAGASIKVTNTATGVVVSTESNETGNYLTPFLPPGTYRLEAERSGFKKFIDQEIVLQTLDKARVDISLELGALSDSVTVSGQATTLQTETANRGATISNELIANLPTQGRNPFQIAWATPGVFKSGGWRYLRSFDIGGTTGFSVNGGRSSENEVLLDGISNVQSSRQVIHVPTMDSIQEFKVLTNTYDAQYGRTGGGTVTIVTKGGTNLLHGNAYEYFQNDKLNANQFELNAAGTPKSPNHINDFGFEVSGPVVIPKVFDGRNKLFWMVAYEGMRQRSADPGLVTVPTMDIRSGDFSTLLNAAGAQVAVYDPLTTQKDGTRTAFAGNKIPASRISPVAVALFKTYPAPTSNGVGPAHVQNYPYPSRWVGDLNQWIGRTDYNINSKNVVFFRYGQNPYSEYRGLVFISDPSQSNPAEPTGNAPLIRNGRNWTADWTSTLNAHMTFDLRAGLSRWEETTGSIYGSSFDQKSAGFDASLVNQFTRNGYPNISLGTYQGMGTNRLVNYSANDAYSLQPNLNWVVGRHFLKFGFETRRYNDNTLNPGLAAGAYTFDKNWTQAVSNRADAASGNEFATFLLGYPTSAYVDRNIDPAFVHYYYAGFFQDDWKLTNRLTVNLGLRWDYETPAYERYDRMVRGLDFNAASPIASQVSGLSLKGTVLFANSKGQPRGAFVPDRNNFAPRIGVAYRLREKWVIRGGYGLYYLGQNATGSNQGYSQRTNAVVTLDSLTPAVTLNNAFALQPGGQLLAAVGNSGGAGSFLGQSVAANWLNRPLPYSHQYSFDIQREFPAGIVVEAAYVGNITRKLPINLSSGSGANYVPTSELGKRTASGAIDTAYYTAQVPNPMAGLIPLNAALNGATISRQNLLYAFPQFSAVSINNLPIGSQRYDAFQIKATKRFAAGMTFLLSYTASKTLEQVAMLNSQFFNLADPSLTPLVKQPADQIDIPRKFNFTGLYELPFGRGKKWAGQSPKVVDYVIGGWELNWNITYMRGWAVNYPNANQVKTGSAKLDNPSIAQWFDTSLWTDPATNKRVPAQEAYTLRTFPLRFSDVRLPGYQNWDASVSKNFALTERIRLNYRLEAVNAFNHPWFTSIASVDVTNAQFGRLSPTQNNLPRFLKMGLNLQW